MTILVTGAAGRTSGYVIHALLKSGSTSAQDLRLFVRSDASSKKVQHEYGLPASAVIIGDYMEQSTLGPALGGIDIVFHNGPIFHPQETAMGIALIDAAKQAGVKHFVYCSVLFPLLTKLLNHQVKLSVEEYLIESGLDYTILEPTSFMQNISVHATLDSGKLRCGYSPSVLQGFLDLQDLAQAARDVLLNPAPHDRARYELVGENCTLDDVAKQISEVSGKQIVCEQIPRDKLVARSIGDVKPEDDYARDALDRMLYYYDKRGIPGNVNTVRWLLGREPTLWKDLVQRELSK